MEQAQITIIVGVATMRDETGLDWVTVVAASELGDTVFNVIPRMVGCDELADALANTLVERLRIVVGDNVERGEVDVL